MIPRPLDPANPPPPHRYCDLVMTGGVTDGVVYPWAVIELAREYHFKNIGGTSVGAMAAALTAAAEYGRRRGRLTGFNDIMMKLPERLGEDVPGVGTRIYSLFQPAKSTARLFELFVRLFSSGTILGAKPSRPQASARKNVFSPGRWLEKARKSWNKVLGFLRPVAIAFYVYRGAASVGALIAYALFLGALGPLDTGLLPVDRAPWLRIVVAVALAILGAAIAVALTIRRDLFHGLLKNHFGMCTGMRVAGVPDDRPSLIEWLHRGVQLAAAKPWDEPLTFRDLWDAPGGPPVDELPPSRRRRPRSIDLHVITTNLTHGRPYEFPLDAGTQLLFDPDELREFFPAAIVDHLVRHSVCYQSQVRADQPDEPPTRGLRILPNADLPIVVAARLSLSFPFLFSAIPLWAVDREPYSRKNRVPRRCRFSDGGACSNFPIHMFDAAVPEWPTFGIALETRSIFKRRQHVWLSKLHTQGADDHWFRFDEEHNPVTGEANEPGDRVAGFLRSLFYSAKDWNDKTASRLPGVRDRIAHVTLQQMGGLDLRITKDEIMELARDYGEPAGRALVRKFINRQSNSPSRAWDEHRWVRFNTFIAGLRERMEMIRKATEYYKYGKPLSAQILDATQDRPLAGDDDAGQPLTPRQAQELEALLQELKHLEAIFAAHSLPQPYRPVPKPGLHIRAPL